MFKAFYSVCDFTIFHLATLFFDITISVISTTAYTYKGFTLHFFNGFGYTLWMLRIACFVFVMRVRINLSSISADAWILFGPWLDPGMMVSLTLNYCVRCNMWVKLRTHVFSSSGRRAARTPHYTTVRCD